MSNSQLSVAGGGGAQPRHPWNLPRSSNKAFRDARFRQTLVLNALDNSPSQHANNGWKEVLQRLPLLVDEVQRNPILQKSVQFATSAFGQGKSTECITPYTPANEFQVTAIPPGDQGSPILELASLAIAYAIQHENSLGGEHDLDIAWNCVFLMTDGHATDPHNLDAFIDINHFAIEQNVDLVIVATGDSPNLPLLTAMSQPGKKPIEMKTVDAWIAFFRDLYVSMRRASQGTLGRDIVIAGTRLRLLR